MSARAGTTAGSSLKSRRALLFGGLAAAAGVVADAVARARPALADDGDPVLVGATTTGTLSTTVESTVVDSDVLVGLATGSGSAGVAGRSTGTTGETAGVVGEAMSATGLHHGVLGRTSSTSGRGVSGRALADTGTAIGVIGVADSPQGIGVAAVGAGGDGVAFQALGRVVFSTSGIATIAKGSKKVIVNPGIPITTSSRILCTLQSNPGGATTVQRVIRNATADVFTIVLTAPATAASRVAWFVISGG